MGSFRDLRVWRAGVDLAAAVHEATKPFPQDEKYRITDQMRRAALSIPLNIAEGAGRATKKDYRRFVHIAIGSTNELETLIVVANCVASLTT